MLRTREYSLWITPPGDIYGRLANLITRLAKEYSTPAFEPHITLLGDIRTSEECIFSKTTELANLIRPFEVGLTTVGQHDDYFRSLFIRVTQVRGIMEANRQARKLFDRENDPVFAPHLSLMYGSLSTQTKEEVISEIGSKFNIVFPVTSIYVVLSSSSSQPRDWRKLGHFILANK